VEVPSGSFVYGHPARTTPLSETSPDVEGLYDRYASGEYATLAARHGELFE